MQMTFDSYSAPWKGGRSLPSIYLPSSSLSVWKVTTGPEYFPSAESNWKKYCTKLAQEEKSATDHKEEVPPDTMNKIYMLLKNTQEAMKHKVSGD